MNYKRNLLFILILFILSGCTNKPDEKDLTKLSPKVDISVGSAAVSWEVPMNLEPADEVYYLTCYTADVKDNQITRNDKVFETELTIPYFNANRHISYYCQENEYFGYFIYDVVAYVDDEIMASGSSEPFKGEDVFPIEKSIEMEGLEINSFSYVSNADYVEGNFSFHILLQKDSIVLYATYFDGVTLDKKTVEKNITLEEWEGLLKLLKDGSLLRYKVSDPEIEMLDGTEEYFRLGWVKQTHQQENYIRFYPNNNKEEISKYLHDLANSIYNIGNE